MRPFVLSVLLALTGCDTAPARLSTSLSRPPVFRASCSSPQLSVCTEYNEQAFALGAELLRTGCTQNHGAWSPARCPSEARLGTCLTSLSERQYYRPGFTSRTAARDCTELQEGHWRQP